MSLTYSVCGITRTKDLFATDIAVAGKEALSDGDVVPSVLALSIEGEELVSLNLAENTEKSMLWVTDGELELCVISPLDERLITDEPYRPADLGVIEFSLILEGPSADAPTVSGAVSLTGYDLLVSQPDDSARPLGNVSRARSRSSSLMTSILGKFMFDVPDSSYKLIWDCVPFCEEASIPEDITAIELRELGVLARQVAALRDQLYKRYSRSGDVADINKAITVAETVCRLGSRQDHVFPFSMHNLGVMCVTCYQDFGDINILERGISALEKAREIFPDTPDQVPLLVTLSSAYAKHYDHGQDNSYLVKSLEAATQAIPLAVKLDSPFIAAAYFAQASVYERQYEGSRDAAVLDLALEACEKALDLVNDADPSKARYQDRLGWIKHQLFDITNEEQYLQESIALGQLAINSTGDDFHKAAYLNNLANSHHTHWQYSKDVASLKQAMLIQRKALDLTPDHSQHKHQYWDTLGTLLVSQWHTTWDQHDIADAVDAHEKAIKLIPHDHGNKAQYLVNLANSYGCMFTQTGDILHLEHALSILHEANSVINVGHPIKPIVLNSMANVYLSQFGLLHQTEDIEQAISGYKEAVRLLGNSNVETPIYMQQLAYALRMKYGHSFEYSDIQEAVSVLEQAHKLMATDHPRKSELLIDLGTSYQSQADFFGVGNDIAMIDRAIEIHKSALKIAPEESHQIALAHSYMARFQGSQDPGDINRAVEIAETDLNKTLDTNPYKVLCYEVLGNAYGVRYEHLRISEDLKRAIRNHEQVAKLSVHQPDRRLESALKWARISMEDPMLIQSSLEAYDFAINLVPQVVWQGLSLSKRYDRIKLIGDLANEAVTVALASQHYEKALEWLERARSILWGQLLRAKTPVETLEKVDPSLGAQYKHLSQQLQAFTATQDINIMKASKLEITQRQMQLAREWELLVEKIQVIPGLEHFLQPHSLTELMKASQDGIIVVIAIYHHECHALAITQDLPEPKHIPLPQFSLEKAEAMQKSLKELLDLAGRVARDVSRKAMLVSKQGSNVSLQDILSELWYSIAKPIMFSLGCVSYFTMPC